MNKRILVPVDGPASVDAVLPLAAGLARTSGGTLRLLHVAPVPEAVVGPFDRVVAYGHQEMERITASELARLADVAASVDAVPVERVVRFGDAVDEILLEAQAFGADLIALAGGRRRWWQPTTVDEVTRRVLRRSPVPVMLLTPGGRR